MDVTIICRSPGMRRCGIEHPAKATYPADRWSAEELAQFQADPAFDVIPVTAAEPSGDADDDAPGVNRIEALKMAIGELAASDRTREGRPKVAALEARLGFKPSSEEIDQAMAEAGTPAG